MRYFRFKNLGKYQHYHDRNPPWVKLYTSILDADNDWYKMTDAECGVLAKLLALAARTGNAMPYNSDVIREEINASGPVDLDKLVGFGFFEVFASRAECVAIEQDRVKALAPASESASKSASKTASESARLRGERSEDQNSEGKDKQEKNPPAPRKRVDGVGEVVEYLNQVTGKRYSLDKGNKEIEGALKRGATVQDCRDVIDRCWRLWSAKPEMVHNVNKVTPFRASHFDTYLDEARAGAAVTGKGASRPKVQYTEAEQAMLDKIRKLGEDAEIRRAAGNG
jgi:uncharacterized phage protein (TIGR02220 family)